MRDYVVIYINKASGENRESQEVISKFRECKIKYKIVDLNKKFDLYGNEISLEGPFALDLSGMPDVTIPVTPLAVAHGKIYSGYRKIFENIQYFQQNYPETNR